jgi:sulfur-carrier protein
VAQVVVRYWAAARAAAGVDEEAQEAITLADLLASLVVGRPAQFAAVLGRSSLLLDGQSVRGRVPESVLLSDGAVVEVLPPFAGG